MKMLIGFTLFLSAQIALANTCPDLTGNFYCDKYGANFSITQSRVGDHTVYTFDDIDLVADGIRKSKKEGYYEFAKTVSCEGSSLWVLDEQISDEYSTHDLKIYGLDDNRNVTFYYEHLEIDEGEEDRFVENLICARQ